MQETLTSQRLYSLDALRGFDMFWIMGADAIMENMSKATGSPFWQTLAEQFTHPQWNGFHFYDLIFPLFLFIAGVATPYSVGRAMEKGKTKQQVLWRVVKRGLILVLLGIIYNNGLTIESVSQMRFASVLGRIGLAYMFANIIYIYSSYRSQIIWFVGILIGYWLMFKFTSARDLRMATLRWKEILLLMSTGFFYREGFMKKFMTLKESCLPFRPLLRVCLES